MAETDDGIIILDEGAPVPGVREVELPPSSKLAKKFASLEIRQAPVPEPEPPKEIFYRYGETDLPVYARHGHLFVKKINDYGRSLAYNQYAYISDQNYKVEGHNKAVAMMMGETKVFAPSQFELDEFKKLLTRFEVKVQPGKTLCVFVDGHGSGLEGHTNFACNSQMDDVVVITMSKDRVRWNDRLAVFDDMDSVLHPNTQEIFTMISRLIDRNTRTLRNEHALRLNEQRLLLSNRNEEIFNYLSDLAPAEQVREIHELLKLRVEEAYVGDQAQLVATLSRIKELDQKIADAKGSLPSGRKGAAIRKSYLEAKLLKDLLLYFDVWRDGDIAELELAFRKDLTLEGIAYGRPVLNVRFCADRANGRDRTHVNNVKAKSQDLRAFLHPHLKETEGWCLGTYSQPVSAAFMSGNIPMVVSLLWQYLNEYNAGSPLVGIEACRSQMEAARPRDLVVRRISK